jgi:hypothetical protein
MKFCNACLNTLSNSNWSYHIETKKHKNKNNPTTEYDNSTIIKISEKTQKQLKLIIDKEKNVNHYYCESCNLWISKTNVKT